MILMNYCLVNMQRRRITSSMGDVCSFQTVLDILGVVIRGGKQLFVTSKHITLSHHIRTVCSQTHNSYEINSNSNYPSFKNGTTNPCSRKKALGLLLYFFILSQEKNKKKKKRHLYTSELR